MTRKGTRINNIIIVSFYGESFPVNTSICSIHSVNVILYDNEVDIWAIFVGLEKQKCKEVILLVQEQTAGV